MRKLTISKTSKVVNKVNMDIEFPIYLKYDGTWDNDNLAVHTQIRRVDEDGGFLELEKVAGFGQVEVAYAMKHCKYSSTERLSDMLGIYILAETGVEYTFGHDATEFEALKAEILEKLQ